MLNYLWSGMILIGLFVAAFTGKMPEVTNAAVDSSKDAVMLAVAMLGIVSMWTGMMKIGEKSGLINGIKNLLMPLLQFLFPRIPKEHKAMEYIASNVIANIIGLGWAATPPGLKAMEELQKINPDKKRASVEMCTFMIFNLSSLQLVSVNIIAYRSQYFSKNPSEVIGPGLIATLGTTVIAVLLAKIIGGYHMRMERSTTGRRSNKYDCGSG